MPSAAYGHNYWTGNDKIVGDVGAAIESGFEHLDTAQGYYDEDKFAQAIKESEVPRSKLYLTTKWSRADTDIQEACENSLRQLHVDYVDLYLIHDRKLCAGDVAGRWKDMEKVKKLGYARSIGVSNFDLHDLKVLMVNAEIVPSVVQNQFDPHSYAESLPLFEYCKEHKITLEAFSPLWPLRTEPDGPISRVTTDVATRLGVEPEQVLLAWCKAKGAAVVTSSSKKARMEGYIRAGDLDLSQADIKQIDAAGWQATTRRRVYTRSLVACLLLLCLGCSCLLWR